MSTEPRSRFYKLRLYAAVCLGVQNPWYVFRNQRRRLKAGEYTLHLRNGLRFHCRNNSADVNEAVAIGLSMEYPQAIINELPRGATVLDLGGHIGAFAIFAARLRPDITVHSYEPCLDNAVLLKRNSRLNGVDHRVVVHRAAACGFDGLAVLASDGATDTIRAVGGAVAAMASAGEQVPARTLWTIFRELGRERVELLKMDIEGGEYDAFEAADGFLSKCDRVLMEWHHDRTGRRNLAWLIDCFHRLDFCVSTPYPNLLVARARGLDS